MNISKTPVGDLKKVKCVNGVITTRSPVAMSAKESAFLKPQAAVIATYHQALAGLLERS